MRDSERFTVQQVKEQLITMPYHAHTYISSGGAYTLTIILAITMWSKQMRPTWDFVKADLQHHGVNPYPLDRRSMLPAIGGSTKAGERQLADAFPGLSVSDI